jgi:thiamine biosynthesis lipoprotein
MTEIRRMRPLLGTFVEIGVIGGHSWANAAIDRAFAKIARLHDLLSFQLPDSELSRLNADVSNWVAVSRETLRVLRLARAFMRKSDHLFNCTIGGALVAQGVLPDHGIASNMMRGNADDIEIATHRARLMRPVRVTLDGIAKGYAVDAAVAILKKQGVSHGWINAGGDMRAFGDHVLPVTQRQADGSMKMLGGLKQAAIATSHVGNKIDPRFPGVIVAGDAVERVALAPAVFSVMARFAWRADALTKVAALAPVTERAQRVTALGGVLIEDISQCAA